MLEFVLDLVLALAVIGVGWRVTTSPDLFTAVILLIVYGLLMSLIWVRLEAPDIALAEAAIGAGLTGALLLDAVRQLERGAPKRSRELASALAALLLAGMLVLVVLSLPREPGGLTDVVLDHLEEGGVAHPITAVLLNFRGYDTWFEVTVLLIAVLSVLVLRREHDLSAVVPIPTDEPLLRGTTRLLVPMLLFGGGYLLWLGTAAPGGAFQAGAVLGSAGVLALMAGYRSLTAVRGTLFHAVLLLGSAAFLLLALALLFTGRALLEYPRAMAGTLITVVEAAVTLSIALTLTALFAGAQTVHPTRRPRRLREIGR